MRRRLALSSTVLATALATAICVAGCAASSGGSASAGSSGAGSSGAGGTLPATGSSAPANPCTPAALHTKVGGTLTVATDSPAYEPWFSDDKPTNGNGFESAVAYAVAEQLGYPTGKVRWVKAPFDSVIAPSPKNYDFDINEVSITAARAKAVDFSSGYYDVAQAIITFKKDKFAKATSIAALKSARLGAQQGTTSLDAVKNVIKPGPVVREYPTNTLAVQALKNGQIDGLAVDLPTGLYLTAAELSGATIIGQLPVTGKPEQFGLVLDKGSPLTSCVTKAVDALRTAGTLQTLQSRWLTTAAGAPVLH